MDQRRGLPPTGWLRIKPACGPQPTPEPGAGLACSSLTGPSGCWEWGAGRPAAGVQASGRAWGHDRCRIDSGGDPHHPARGPATLCLHHLWRLGSHLPPPIGDTNKKALARGPGGVMGTGLHNQSTWSGARGWSRWLERPHGDLTAQVRASAPRLSRRCPSCAIPCLPVAPAGPPSGP